MNEGKKVPLRKCVVTGERLPKMELVRVVKTPEGAIIIDKTSKANGRGAYLKLAKEVILKAKKTKALDRSLETTIPDSIYDDLLELLKNE